MNLEKVRERFRFRFSLRTLFIFISCLALVLGYTRQYYFRYNLVRLPSADGQFRAFMVTKSGPWLAERPVSLLFIPNGMSYGMWHHVFHKPANNQSGILFFADGIQYDDQVHWVKSKCDVFYLTEDNANAQTDNDIIQYVKPIHISDNDRLELLQVKKSSDLYATSAWLNSIKPILVEDLQNIKKGREEIVAREFKALFPKEWEKAFPNGSNKNK